MIRSTPIFPRQTEGWCIRRSLEEQGRTKRPPPSLSFQGFGAVVVGFLLILLTLFANMPISIQSRSYLFGTLEQNRYDVIVTVYFNQSFQIERVVANFTQTSDSDSAPDQTATLVANYTRIPHIDYSPLTNVSNQGIYVEEISSPLTLGPYQRISITFSMPNLHTFVQGIGAVILISSGYIEATYHGVPAGTAFFSISIHQSGDGSFPRQASAWEGYLSIGQVPSETWSAINTLTVLFAPILVLMPITWYIVASKAKTGSFWRILPSLVMVPFVMMFLLSIAELQTGIFASWLDSGRYFLYSLLIFCPSLGLLLYRKITDSLLLKHKR